MSVIRQKLNTNHNLDIDMYRNAITMPRLVEKFGIRLNGNRKIPCPLHAEKDASAHVYDDHIYCFGCGERLDAISFVGLRLFNTRKPEGSAFWDCLDWIANESGLQRPKRDTEAQTRYEVTKTSSQLYETIWQDARHSPNPGIEYLVARGISQELAEKTVGYLPRGYKPHDIEKAREAGLYSQKGNFLFADRAIIPVRYQGRIINLYGRALDNKRIPKHVYCGTTDPAMPKTFYGLNEISGGHACLTESIIDCLTLQTYGLQALGLYGTQSMTGEMMEHFRYAKIAKITLCFDADANGTGQRAALEIGETFFRSGIETEILTLPLGQGNDKEDINSYFQKHTIDDFRGLSPADFFHAKLENSSTTASPNEQLNIVKELADIVSSQNDLLWEHYVEVMHERFNSFDKRKLKNLIKKQRGELDEDVGAKAFRPLDYVEAIGSKTPVISFDGRIYRYANGVYSMWWPEEIDQETIELIGRNTQPYQLDAIKRMLSSKYFVHREKVNPLGIINLNNGILNIHSGSFDNHSPDLLSTIQSSVNFDPKATCPIWEETVAKILPDVGSQKLLSQMFGYCLVPSNPRQVAFILVGDGGNGKGLLTMVLEHVLGKQNCSALFVSDLKHNFRLAELQNKLVNFCPEVESKGFVDDQRVKAIISGDTITAERKNQHPFVFRPQARLIISCNTLPSTTDKSFGYFRRWIILPFTQTFSGKNADPALASKILEHEASGVLNWSLGGLKSLVESDGFIIPEASKAALEEYRKDTDHTIDFAAEKIRRKKDSVLTLKDIMPVYRAWTEDNGIGAMGRNNLRKALERTLKIKTSDTNGAKCFRGVVWK